MSTQQPLQRATRSLVRRYASERYLLLSLLAFAASVITTRLFLSLTGYPQLGNSDLHIAHVLWGGLLLFVAGLLPLLLANNWAYTASAIINGIGMGLFIDEIGKFITQNNNYFYPAAAPIIYAFFIMIAMLYAYLRRNAHRSPRRELYQVMADMGEVIDHDLDIHERSALAERLQHVVAEDQSGNLSLLAEALLVFLNDEALRLADFRPSRWQLWKDRLQAFGQRVDRAWFRRWLTGLAVGSGAIGIGRAWGVLAVLFTNLDLTPILEQWLVEGRFHSAGELRWLFVRIGLEWTLGALLITAAILLSLGRERTGVDLAVLSLTLLLTTVDLLVFYFDQFSAVAAALAQYALLAQLLTYRQWYLKE